jgi:Type I restriction modification DNA specificity domain
MSNAYIKIPNSISFNSIVEKDYTLSSSQYMDLIMPNENFLFVKDFLKRDLQRKDLGVEVGSLNYIGQSTHYFVRTKALQAHSFLPEITSETALPIMPNSFVKMNLKQGDLLISKDSNIGEVVILDKDYPNCMLSGAIYKLPVTEKKYYLLAFIKHNIFREQLDFMVPKGATIRHAKTMFLDCKIPLPNSNTENVINFVEVLTQAIINKEQLIKERHEAILKSIETELLENQKPNKFSFELPRINELEEVGRLDTGLYNASFKKLDFLIKSYSNGFSLLKNLKYKPLRGPNLAISIIGVTHYSSKRISDKFYKLIQPTDLSDYGTLQTERYFGNINDIQLLKKGDILFGAEGNIGKVYVNIDMNERSVTNFHGMSITNPYVELYNKCFISCYITWLRYMNFFKFYSTGGQGGSFGVEKTEKINVPNFPEAKQKEIAKLYHNSEIEYKADTFTLANFLDKDNEYNEEAGIYELDKTAKQLREILNRSIDDVINDKVVKIKFDK